MKEAEKALLVGKIRDGDVAWVDDFLSNNPDYCYMKTAEHESLLHLAACVPGVAMFNTIEKYTDPQDDEDELPRFRTRAFTNKSENILHYAVYSRNIKLCELLVRENPKLLSQYNSEGKMPFDYIDDKFRKLFRSSLVESQELCRYYILHQYNLQDSKPKGTEKAQPYQIAYYDAMLAACAEKKSRRIVKNKLEDMFLVIADDDEFKVLLRKLKSLPAEANITLQFAQRRNHWIGGEIRLRDGSLEMMLFDSVCRVEYLEPYVGMVRSEFPNAIIRTNFDVIQSGKGKNCSILVQNFMFHASNQSEFCDLMGYMASHPVTLADIEEIKRKEVASGLYRGDGTNVSDVIKDTFVKGENLGIKMGKMPLRLIRDMESLGRMGIRETQENEEVLAPVNHKNRNFIESRNRFVLDVGEGRSINARSLESFKKRKGQIEAFLSVPGFIEKMQMHTVGSFCSRNFKEGARGL